MDVDQPPSRDSPFKPPPVGPPLGDQEPGLATGQASTSGQGGSLEECLALLKGQSDERRLVGLLLATRFVSSGDLTAVEAIFDAVGWSFIGRLFKTGGGGAATRPLGPYAVLALSLVSAFVRVPRLASASEAIERVPLFLGVVRRGEVEGKEGVAEGPVGDALECLLAIASASEEGLRVELESGGVAAVCDRLGRSKGDESWFATAVRLLGTSLGSGESREDSAREGEAAVSVLARECARRNDALVFECLGCLMGLLNQTRLGLQGGAWKDDVRKGVGNLLQSRHVKAEHRLGALKLASLTVDVIGEGWLTEDSGASAKGPGGRNEAEGFLLVLLNTVKVELAVQLNEVARGLFGEERTAGANGSADMEGTVGRGGTAGGEVTAGNGVTAGVAPGLAEAVSSCYALLEAGVNALAQAATADVTTVARTGASVSGSSLSGDTIQKAFGALMDATAVVIDFLEQAKEHGQNSDDIVLASVRVLGRFLAEVPEAHQEKVGGFLGFLLSVKGSDSSEASDDSDGVNVGGVWCMLPALGQMSEDGEGCKIVVREKAHRAVAEFARDVIRSERNKPAKRVETRLEGMQLDGAENTEKDPVDAMVGCALDVILNVLDHQASGGPKIRFSDVQAVLPALVTWTRGKPTDPLRLALSAAVISNTLLLTEEKAAVDRKLDLGGMLDTVVLFLDESFAAQKGGGGQVFDWELWEITLAAGVKLLETFPSFESRVRESRWMRELRVMSGGGLSRSTIEQFSGHGALLAFLAAAAEKEQPAEGDA